MTPIVELSKDSETSFAKASSAVPPRADRESFARRLNAMDCTILAVHQAVQSLAGPGFDTQAVLSLSGQIDLGAFRSALGKLRVRYPGITCSLSKNLAGKLSWRQTSSELHLSDARLPGSSDEEIWRELAALLSKPRDLFAQPGIDFHVLRLTDDHDVVVMQYNHTLMDNPAALSVLREVDALFPARASVDGASSIEEEDHLRKYLAGFTRRQRLTAAWKTVKLRLHSIRGNIATLGEPRPASEGSLALQVARREFDAAETRLLSRRVADECGFPGLSMPLLASVLRTLERLVPHRAGSRFTVGIGLDLGLRGDRGPFFQNLSTVVPIVHERIHMASQSELARDLTRQLRERLEQRIDLGVVGLASLFRNQPRFLRFAMRQLMRHGYTAWYAYFGSADAVGESFCGVAIDDFQYVGPCWPSVGLTLVGNQFRGRLHLQGTYVPACLSPEAAEAFMDALVADLRTWIVQPR
jgi:hypothetical protein